MEAQLVVGDRIPQLDENLLQLGFEPALLREKRTGDNSVGNHYFEFLLAFQAFHGLMSRRPKSTVVLYMDDLFLLAVAAGYSHSDVGLFQLGLGHNPPPCDMLGAGRFSVKWMAVQTLC
jgi:hypothetical protein